MQRRDLFRISTATALAAALPGPAAAGRPAPAEPLRPPAEGPIPVAFVLSAGAVVIDFAGPWEVFDNASVPGRGEGPAFQLYTVAETLAPIRASGGMTVVPDFTFDTAPAARVVVIPAQGPPTEALLGWIRKAARTADLTMSVCTGAFVLAKTGLLAGRSATTHHGSYSTFAMQFPDISLRRGARFVETGNLASSGGLSSGIDLALRVVERYFGRAVALNTADALEYQGQGWLDPDANRAYAKPRRLAAAQALCPVCEMVVDKAGAPASAWRGRTYHFCMTDHKKVFDANPGAFSGR
ncbi:DJ-1/PfpI family protein [Massilia sp. METH4]|uniref:DJ-1/PfpI family protein n=1 Tax=Massilia sp. METH4 TaxID=3123041 RepID=UPI0030D563BD